MTISPELQAKIDALPEQNIKDEIRETLEMRNRKSSDEEIFEIIVERYQMAKEQKARLRKWQTSEVIAFIEYFQVQAPDLYAKYLQHEKDLRQKELDGVDEDERWFDPDIWWDMEALAKKWMPGLQSMDSTELLGGVLDHARGSLI